MSGKDDSLEGLLVLTLIRGMGWSCLAMHLTVQAY